MEKMFKIKSTSLLLSMLLLIVLILFSPCKVRNSIEQFFGLEKTVVLNKNKTTVIELGTCHTLSEQTPSTELSIVKKNFGNVVLLFDGIYTLKDKYITIITGYFNPIQSKSKVPFYILYHHIKVYL